LKKKRPPVKWVVISLWARQIYFGVYLQSIWLQESLDRWIRSHAEMFGATLAVLLLLVAPTLILSRIPRYFLLVIINLALTSVIVADRISIRFYGDVISLANLTSWPMMNAAVWSVVRTVRFADSLYYLDIVVALLIFPLYARFCRRIEPVDQMIRRRVSLVMPTTGLMLAIPALQLIWQNQNGASAYSNLQREICAAIGVVPYHLLDGVTRHSLPHFKVSDSARTHPQLSGAAATAISPLAAGRNCARKKSDSDQCRIASGLSHRDGTRRTTHRSQAHGLCQRESVVREFLRSDASGHNCRWRIHRAQFTASDSARSGGDAFSEERISRAAATAQ
jgi:hypothetical protein